MAIPSGLSQNAFFQSILQSLSYLLNKCHKLGYLSIFVFNSILFRLFCLNEEFPIYIFVYPSDIKVRYCLLCSVKIAKFRLSGLDYFFLPCFLIKFKYTSYIRYFVSWTTLIIPQETSISSINLSMIFCKWWLFSWSHWSNSSWIDSLRYSHHNAYFMEWNAMFFMLALKYMEIYSTFCFVYILLNKN